MNSRLRHQPSDFVMSNSFTNQVLAQRRLVEEQGHCEKSVFIVCPKKLDEEVAQKSCISKKSA